MSEDKYLTNVRRCLVELKRQIQCLKSGVVCCRVYYFKYLYVAFQKIYIRAMLNYKDQIVVNTFLIPLSQQLGLR